MTINEIYRVLRERGLVASLRGFSRDYLGRAANYAADRRLDRCTPATLVHLHRRLGAVQQTDLQARVLERLLHADAARSARALPVAVASASLAGERA